MRSALYLALAALFGGLWHSVLCAVLMALGGVGLGPPALPLLGSLVDWDPLPILASVLTSVVTAAVLRRFITRCGVMPASLGFWTLGGALWPIVFLGIATGVDALRLGWERALGEGETLTLALVAPYMGIGLSALLIWIVWPLAALEVWVLARVLGPLVRDGEEELATEPASG